MEPAEQIIALQKRVILANKRWGSFFSKMPLRDASPQLLRVRPLAIIARPAKKQRSNLNT
jgi:hypothetical protein